MASSISQFAEFGIRRHRLPSAVPGLAPERQERHFTLKPEGDFPSPVECVVTVPDWVDVNGEERSLKVSLRMRAKRHSVDHCGAVPMEGVDPPSAATSTSAHENSPGPQSAPMERAHISAVSEKHVDAEEAIATHVIELGMEVEETERYS